MKVSKVKSVNRLSNVLRNEEGTLRLYNVFYDANLTRSNYSITYLDDTSLKKYLSPELKMEIGDGLELKVSVSRSANGVLEINTSLESLGNTSKLGNDLFSSVNDLVYKVLESGVNRRYSGKLTPCITSANI